MLSPLSIKVFRCKGISLLAVLMLLGACDGPRRIEEVQDSQLYQAAFADMRLDRAARLRPAIPNVAPQLYGFDTTRTGSPENNVTFDADWCEVDGRRFYFVTQPVLPSNITASCGSHSEKSAIQPSTPSVPAAVSI